MTDLLMIGLFLFAWIALNRWVLPALGIQTCMSGGCCGGDSCRVPARPVAQSGLPKEEQEVGSAKDQ